MIFASGFFNTIILLGAVQGFIVSSLLFFSKKNKQSNRLLSILILLIALASFNLYANHENWFNSRVLQFISNFIPLVIVMPLGPLIYFYIRSCLDPSFKVKKKQRPHFYPVIIDLVPQITVCVYLIVLYSGFIKNNPKPIGDFIDNYNVYADIPRWLSVSYYVWMSSKYLAVFKTKHNGALNAQAKNFKSLQQFIRIFFVFQGIWLIYLVPYVTPLYTDLMLDTFDWYPIYVPMAVIIYWLGIKGFLISNADVISGKKSTVNNSALSDAIIKQAILSIKKAMDDDQIYLNPNLSLSILSEHTGIAQKMISAVLNQHLYKSFNELVNEYRITAFKEKIVQPEMDNLTIAGVAFECGFNSQATFQRTFKQTTGLSPSEFRNSVLQAQA